MTSLAFQQFLDRLLTRAARYHVTSVRRFAVDTAQRPKEKAGAVWVIGVSAPAVVTGICLKRRRAVQASYFSFMAL